MARDPNRCIELGGNIHFLAKRDATDGKELSVHVPSWQRTSRSR